ncbi:hypothetical protein ACFLY7_02020 [Patescibacteria group bacterium]
MEKEIKWEAPEYEYRQKSSDWFWVVWIIAIGITITSFIYKNPLFGVLIILSTFTLSIYAVRKPNIAKFFLNKKGIKANNKFYSYEDISTFWINDEDNNPKIIFKLNRSTAPYLIIPLKYEINIHEIKDYLSENLKEEEMNEPLLQKIIGRIKLKEK